MNPKAADQYLRTKVLTATPEQLQLMLYDGAIRFAETGKAAIEKKDFEATYNNFSRAQRILVELMQTLRPQHSPDLCAKLSALYRFAYKKLVDACVHHQIEARPMTRSQVLKYQRETWSMLLDQLGKTKAAAAAQSLDFGAPDARMEAQFRASA